MAVTPGTPASPAPSAGTPPEPLPPPWSRRMRERLADLWSILRANPLTLVGFVLVAALVAVAAIVVLVPAITGLAGAPRAVTPYDPIYGFSTDRLQGPSSAHWLGTDEFGLDMFSRVLAALPIDLAIAFAIAGFGLVVGGSLGLVAGYWNAPWTVGGVISGFILRMTDIFLSIPSLLLALAIIEVAGRGIPQTILALMLTWWPYYVRLVRGEVQAIKQQPYITAARAAGVRDGTIVVRHVLRNLLEPVVVYFTMDVGTVIVVFSTVAFITGAFPPTVPEWGTMIQPYVEFLPTYPWPVLSISLAIIVTVLAFSLLGDGLRDILDPRSRRVLAQAGAAVPAATPAPGSGP